MNVSVLCGYHHITSDTVNRYIYAEYVVNAYLALFGNQNKKNMNVTIYQRVSKVGVNYSYAIKHINKQ